MNIYITSPADSDIPDPRHAPSPVGVQIYAGVLAAVAASVGVALVVGGVGFGPPVVVIAVAAVAAFAERGTVRLSSTIEDSISALPIVFTAVLFGPLAAFAVAAASMLGDFTRPYLRWSIYTSTRAIAGASIGGLSLAIHSSIENGPLAIAVGTLVAAAVAQLLDAGFAGLTVQLRGRGDAKETFRLLLPVAASAVPVYAPLVAFLAIAYTEVSAWATLLFFVPSLAAQRLYGLYQAQRQSSEELSEANAQLERVNLSFASGLVATLDARDQYTAGHSAAVAVYSRDIARRMGLDESRQQEIYISGLVHDIGKIGLSAGLLEKPGALTLEERRQMQEHSAIGERILANVETYPDIAVIVRHHHERVDGNGYPDKLVGEEIPLHARIISVADAYNAMTSSRPYREAMPSRVARLRLAQAVESQFDTSVVAAFEAILAGADEAYRTATSPEFSFGSIEPAPEKHDPEAAGAIAGAA